MCEISVFSIDNKNHRRLKLLHANTRCYHHHQINPHSYYCLRFVVPRQNIHTTYCVWIFWKKILLNISFYSSTQRILDTSIPLIQSRGQSIHKLIRSNKTILFIMKMHSFEYINSKYFKLYYWRSLFKIY